jgi:hypothetical protein
MNTELVICLLLLETVQVKMSISCNQTDHFVFMTDYFVFMKQVEINVIFIEVSMYWVQHMVICQTEYSSTYQ